MTVGRGATVLVLAVVLIVIMVTIFGHVRAVCNPKYRPVAHCQPVLHAFAPEASSDHHSCLKDV